MATCNAQSLPELPAPAFGILTFLPATINLCFMPIILSSIMVGTCSWILVPVFLRSHHFRNVGPWERKISIGTQERGTRKFRNANFCVPGVLFKPIYQVHSLFNYFNVHDHVRVHVCVHVHVHVRVFVLVRIHIRIWTREEILEHEKNIRNVTWILERKNANARNAKKQRKKNAGTGNVKGKMRNAGMQDAKGF